MAMRPGGVEALVKYQRRLPIYEHERPFYSFLDLPEGAKDARLSNLEFEDVSVVLHDIRHRRDEFSLDGNGFSVKDDGNGLADINVENAEEVWATYLPHVEGLIRASVPEATKVIIFHWQLRTSLPLKPGAVINLNDGTDWARPSEHVHIDQAVESVINLVYRFAPDEAEELLKGQVRVVNAWRPLKGPLRNWPLGLCDGGTVDPADLSEADFIRGSGTDATIHLYHNPGHRWYFLDAQTPDEVLLLKIFDSRAHVGVKYCPHASFAMPGSPADYVRESIEVRTLVFSP